MRRGKAWRAWSNLWSRGNWRALDVATGAGHMAAAFAPHVTEIIASDVTAEMLAEAGKLAAARGLANMTTANAPADALPFEDETFDLVCCRLAAHHFPDVAAFISESHRVLKPGGVFALVDNVSPDVADLPGTSRAAVRDAAIQYNAFEKLRDPSHGRALTAEEWAELTTDCEFEITAREQLAKELDFAGYVARMRCDATTIASLEHTLEQGPMALQRFLRPRRDNGAWFFTLQELLLVARKPA